MVIYNPQVAPNRPEFDVTYRLDPNEKVWHKEWIFFNEMLFGQICTNIDGEGFILYKYMPQQLEEGEQVLILSRLRTFPTVQDTKDFIQSNVGTLYSKWLDLPPILRLERELTLFVSLTPRPKF